jgi:DNA helicase HerA-like ATPase
VLDEFHFFLNNKDLKNEINKLLRESRKIDLSVIISIQEQENTILNS